VRAAVVTTGGRFELVDQPEPEPGPGELVVRVTACGLCGSDAKARFAMPPGTVMGHEFGGEVVAAGSQVSGWRAGTQVAVLPVLSCGRCAWCRAGFVVYCEHARLIGLGGAPGGFAEYAVVRPAAAFVMPEQVDPVHSALVEPFVVGLHCLRAATNVAGADVLVIGAGSVGLTSMVWARLLGAHRITAVDPIEGRRARAVASGASDAVSSLEDVEPSSYDLVIECVGAPGLLDRCLALVRPRSQIVVAGVCIEPDELTSMAALMKEVSIHFAVYYTPDDFRSVIEAIAGGQIDPATLLSAQHDLGTLNEAFNELAASTAGGKILLTP